MIFLNLDLKRKGRERKECKLTADCSMIKVKKKKKRKISLVTYFLLFKKNT